MIAVYDGSFEGFLTLVHSVYYKKLKISKIMKTTPQTLFVDDIVEIESSEIDAYKVLEAIKNKFEKRHFETILNTFMCDTIAFELDLLHFIIMGFRDQQQLYNINHTFVFNIQNHQKELFRLYHRMSGFIRFEELEDATLYGKIDVKFNVVYLLGRHFLKRFNNQSFIIHDLKRELAFVKSDAFTGVRSVVEFEPPTLSSSETKFQKLWQTFFESVAVESRQNKRLQQQFVPLIYRTYMSEFD
jgi:probable DNA metabolism protein